LSSDKAKGNIVKKQNILQKGNKMLPNKTVFKYYIIGLGKKER